jgi:hypothetical protein
MVMFCPQTTARTDSSNRPQAEAGRLLDGHDHHDALVLRQAVDRQHSRCLPILPKVTNIGLQIFVTCTF